MKKVVANRQGIIHHSSFCAQCDFNGDDISLDKTRKNAKNHAKETGHKTTIETGSSTEYELIGWL